jgi:hypothetical protein
LQGIPANSLKIRAYLDETTTIDKTLADKDSNDYIFFTNSLTTGSHTALIYLTKNNEAYNRWTNNAPNSLIIKNIILGS